MNRRTQLARRMEAIEPFQVMELLAHAQRLESEGAPIIHMEIGEPDFTTAAPIVEAGIQALRDGRTGYTAALGIPELREAIAGFYEQRYGLSVAPERIIVTPGASGALQLVLGVLVNPGSRVLMTDPGYPCNRHFVRLFEGEPVPVAVNADTAYQLTPEHLCSHWDERTVAALVASPSNPTGTLVPEQDLRAMAADCGERGGTLIVDEIYHGLVYEQSVTSAAGFDDDVFVINSFSKYFGMTGWRLGWIVAPEAWVREIEKLAQNIFLSASTPAQYAALTAFAPDNIEIMEARRETFRERRDFLLPALQEAGFDIPVQPAGAFYIYANSARFSADSHALAWQLLEDAHVAITPGTDFGSHRAREHVRIAYTTSVDNLGRAVDRLATTLSRHE